MKKQLKQIIWGATLLASLPLYASNLSGLWLASVEVNKVNEVHSSSVDINTPTKVKYSFNLQFIFHMDAGGSTKLLKEVYIMQTKANINKKRVLVTDEKRLSDFEGIIRKGDNKLVPVRFTSPSIDFDSTKNSIALTGSISNNVGSTIIAQNIIHDKLHPTNPFRHQFHPNHKEGLTINRSFTITIKAPNSTAGTGNTSPNVGKTKLLGTYEETLVGLHKVPLKVSGSVILTQISTIGILNPSASGE